MKRGGGRQRGPLSIDPKNMESLLAKINAASADPEELWPDLEELNEEGYEAMTRQVDALKKTVKGRGGSEDEEEDFDDEDEGEFDDEDDDENDSDEDVDFDSLDPKEQLRLLMEPCEDDSGFSDDEYQSGADSEGEEDDDMDSDGHDDKKKIKFSLLNDDGEEDDQSEAEDKPQSTFQKQQARLKRTIAELEEENVAGKDWTLRGEINAGARPQDSLLQEDLEFEHVAKMAPTITPEVTEGLEELIRKRIKDRAWDDVERIPEEVIQAQLKEKAKKITAAVALDDGKSKLSLAEQYEADFEAAAARKAKADLKDEGLLDEATKAAHEDIRRMFGKLCKTIDELSQNKFAPRSYDLAEVEIKTLKKAK